MKAKKHFGQHFLTSNGTAKSIVSQLGDITEKKVLEIGPGMGIITQFMVHHAQEFKAIEIDDDAADYLEKSFIKINVVRGDFLKVDLSSIFTDKFNLIGNFPYNISSQIVFKILENADSIPTWVGMFQLEMGFRLIAQPSDKKQYGILSVLTPFYYEVNEVMKLPPEAFNPPPKVNSIVVRAIRREHPWQCSPKLLKLVVKTAFNQRRKTLSNSLSSIIEKEILNTHDFSTLRPENLSYLQFEELCVFIEQHVNH